MIEQLPRMIQVTGLVEHLAPPIREPCEEESQLWQLTSEQEAAVEEVRLELAALHCLRPPRRPLPTSLPLCNCCSALPLPWRMAPPASKSIWRTSGECWVPDEKWSFLVALAEDLLSGAVEPDDGSPDFIRASSLVFFVRHPVSNKLRLCHDLRDLNNFMEPGFVRYGSVSSLIAAPMACAMKFDLKSAFKGVRLCRKDCPYLGFIVNGRRFRYRSLTFGLSCAPCGFCAAFSPVVQELAETFPFAIFVVFMDDLIVAATSFAEAVAIARYVISLTARRGWWLSVPKCFFKPAAVLRTLGFIFDVRSTTLSLSPSKATKTAAWLRRALNTHLDLPVRLSALESALGMVSFFSTVFPPLKLLRVSLITASCGRVSLLDPLVVEEARALITLMESPFFLRQLVRRASSIPNACLPYILAVDASDVCAGAVLLLPSGLAHVAFSPLPEYLLGAGSAAREVAAIYLGIQRFAPLFSAGGRLRIFSDSLSGVHAISRCSAKSPHLAREIIKLLRLCASLGIYPEVSWCRRDAGLQPLADWGSRQLPPLPRLSAFGRSALLRYFRFDVDLAALSEDTAVAPLWFSPGFPVSLPVGSTDAVENVRSVIDGPANWCGLTESLDWAKVAGMSCFAFPPPSLLGVFIAQLTAALRDPIHAPECVVLLVPPSGSGRAGELEGLLGAPELCYLWPASQIFDGQPFLMSASGLPLPPLEFQVAVLRPRSRPSLLDNDEAASQNPGPIAPLSVQPAFVVTSVSGATSIKPIQTPPSVAVPVLTPAVNLPQPGNLPARTPPIRPPPRRIIASRPAIHPGSYSLPVSAAQSWDLVSLGELRAAVLKLARAPPSQERVIYTALIEDLSEISSLSRSVAAHTGPSSWTVAVSEASIFYSFLTIEVQAPNERLLSHWSMGTLAADYLVGRTTGCLRLSPWLESTRLRPKVSARSAASYWSTLVCRLKCLFPAVGWKSRRDTDWPQVKQVLSNLGCRTTRTTPKVGTYMWELAAISDATPAVSRTLHWQVHFGCCLFISAFMLRPCYGRCIPRGAVTIDSEGVAYSWNGLTKRDMDLFADLSPLARDVHYARSWQPLLVSFFKEYCHHISPNSDDPLFPGVSPVSLSSFLKAELHRIGVPDAKRRTPGGIRAATRSELAAISRAGNKEAEERAIIDRLGWWAESGSVGRKTYEKDDEAIASRLLSRLGTQRWRDTVRGSMRLVADISTRVVQPSQSIVCTTRKRPRG